MIYCEEYKCNRGGQGRKEKEKRKKYIKVEVEVEKSKLIAWSLVWKMYLNKTWKTGFNKVRVTNHGHDHNV